MKKYKHEILHCVQELRLTLKCTHTVKAFLPLEELVGQSTKLNLSMQQESAESKVHFKHILLTSLLVNQESDFSPHSSHGSKTQK
jgi:hypothetical protein